MGREEGEGGIKLSIFFVKCFCKFFFFFFESII